jgi:hypothetical protein
VIEPLTLSWRDKLVLSREISVPGDRAVLFAAVNRGDFHRVRRGVFARRSEWDGMSPDDRYRLAVHAEAAWNTDPQVWSHESTAALWRLPSLGRWPAVTHVVAPVAAGGRSTSSLRRHAVGIPSDLERIDGLAVTTLARTAIDLAASRQFASAVVFLDAALRRTDHPFEGLPRTLLTRADLVSELDVRRSQRGVAMARRAIAFSDGRADRPGESVSRVNMFRAGLTMPCLQAELRGASGRRWFVDFWWPLFNLIGEFDGLFKYTDPEFLRGRTPEQALRDEKEREDDLRAAGHGMTRWGWQVANSMVALRTQLLRAGVR